ncbi:MAG: hypothetical protein FD123_265 [Bacteroidetes bacterium]|nr:MAG: hypothetical protein FD123_265 [Bacteroidota bacterium]
MRLAIIILLLLFLASCAKESSPVACAGVNKNLSARDGMAAVNGKSTKDAVFFKRHKRQKKAEDGFRKKEKRSRQPKEKAEKGKKKEKTSKAERRWRMFVKKRSDEKASESENKKLFHTNHKKRKKEIKKKAKHPEMGLFPKDMRK